LLFQEAPELVVRIFLLLTILTLSFMVFFDSQDPAVEIREKCTQTKECAALLEKFNACNERVSSKSATTETCVEEQSDFLHCVDHCVCYIFYFYYLNFYN
jgi:ubiquinol-cytochrome c reductase subunit 6